ncbi:methylated-DNA--[protein]-cysteine S-methyltransferase [Lagierella massiliensis]|uniref:methylated-DNA--[protein]-cysteine S-methyltransferase n=1 Tax=Lagierella massiliensis TaxID=1689303 RepID=UPI0006D7BD41|nr:methylated-DNA--[protein]-cysteine S-methyltransferase [Lagierella massiliensis]
MKNFFEFVSPIGTLYIGEEDGFVIDISFEKPIGERRKTDVISKTIAEIEEYFNHKRTDFDIPIKLRGTKFQKEVYEYVRKISYGNRVSYSEVAKGIGSISRARAVGNALNKNPILILIPCHRVIKKSGEVGGFKIGLDNKNFLLNLERENYVKKI